MDQKSNPDEIDLKIEKLMQLQEFTTVQITLLTIVSSLFVVSIMAIVTNFSSLLTLISTIILFLESIILSYLLIFSLFSRNMKTKVESFLMIIFFILIVFVSLSLNLLYFGISLWLSSTFFVNNIVIVTLLLLAFVLSLIIFFRGITPGYKRRFILLLEKEETHHKEKILTVIKTLTYTRLKRFALSVNIAFLLSFFTGLSDTATNVVGMNYYGFPFPWMVHRIGSNIPKLSYVGFILDLSFFIIVIYFIFSVVNCFKYGKKTERVKEKTNLENIPGFVPYK